MSLRSFGYFLRLTATRSPLNLTFCSRNITYNSKEWESLYQSSQVLIQQRSNQRSSHLLADKSLNYSLSPLSRIPNTKCDDRLSGCKSALIADRMISQEQGRVMTKLAQASNFQHFFTSPGERKLAIISKEDQGGDYIYELLGDKLVTILLNVKLNLRSTLNEILNKHRLVPSGNDLVESGSILSWLSPAPYEYANTRRNPRTVRYWDTHCDKANNFEYDLSVLLYLNSDFEGGEFVFVDEDADYIVQPKTGRFLVFTSSVENIHRVGKVLKGDRLALTTWYSVRP